MTKACRMVLGVLFLATITFSAAPAPAQDQSADKMKILVEKVRADKKLLVSENMKLTDAEGKGFWPVYDRYQDELFLIRARTLKLIGDYTESYEKLTNENAKKLLKESMTIESLRVKLNQTYLPKFEKVLPASKVVRYFQIENKINAALMYEIASTIPLAGIKE